MSTIITGAIVIAGTIGIVWFLIFINNRNNKRRNKTLINVFNEAGAGQGLTFSSQEVLRDKIIGLDGQHLRLLVFDFLHTDAVTSIKLSEVKECALQKEYQNVNFGNEKNADMEKTLRTIAIMFSFKNRPELFSLSFYDSMLYSIYEIAELEAKAKAWEILLSKLILKDIKATA